MAKSTKQASKKTGRASAKAAKGRSPKAGKAAAVSTLSRRSSPGIQVTVTWREIVDVLDVAHPLNMAGVESREAVRQVVEEGLPVEAVKALQEQLKRFGVARPSTYVESIATRAARSRRKKLTAQEGERLVRVAAILARALDVWDNEEAAAEFLTTPHPELGEDTPIDRALSEIGARQVEDLLLRLDLGIPV